MLSKVGHISLNQEKSAPALTYFNMRHDIPEPRSKLRSMSLSFCGLLCILQYNFSFMELKQQIPDPTSLLFAHEKASLF